MAWVIAAVGVVVWVGPWLAARDDVERIRERAADRERYQARRVRRLAGVGGSRTAGG